MFGRPAALGADQRDAVLAGLAEHNGVAELARQLGNSRQTIMRVRDGAGGRSFCSSAPLQAHVRRVTRRTMVHSIRDRQNGAP